MIELRTPPACPARGTSHCMCQSVEVLLDIKIARQKVADQQASAPVSIQVSPKSTPQAAKK